MTDPILYIAGPMSRASFCRCDRPSAPGTLAIPTDLKGVGEGDPKLNSDVFVGQSSGAVHSHFSSDVRCCPNYPHGALLPKGDLLQGANAATATQERQHVSQQSNSIVAVGGPEMEGLPTEPIRVVGPSDTPNLGALAHQFQDVSVGRGDFDAERAVVGLTVNDGSLPLVDSSAPGNVKGCPLHDFILPDNGIDPWDNNYPAFFAAEEQLRAVGFTRILNPVRRIIPADSTWEAFMRSGLRMVLDAEALVLLPGWARSKGAVWEWDTAQRLGMPCYDLETWLATAVAA